MVAEELRGRVVVAASVLVVALADRGVEHVARCRVDVAREAARAFAAGAGVTVAGLPASAGVVFLQSVFVGIHVAKICLR